MYLRHFPIPALPPYDDKKQHFVERRRRRQHNDPATFERGPHAPPGPQQISTSLDAHQEPQTKTSDHMDTDAARGTNNADPTRPQDPNRYLQVFTHSVAQSAPGRPGAGRGVPRAPGEHREAPRPEVAVRTYRRKRKRVVLKGPPGWGNLGGSGERGAQGSPGAPGSVPGDVDSPGRARRERGERPETAPARPRISKGSPGRRQDAPQSPQRRPMGTPRAPKARPMGIPGGARKPQSDNK